MSKIKCALTLNEKAELQNLTAGKRVIEIGALLGGSTITMARVAEQVTSIDPHDGYPYYNPTPTYDIFMANIHNHGVARKIFPIVDYAENVLPTIKEQFDVAFIDCTGEYKLTKFCLQNTPAKILTVHDFQRFGCRGVERSVEEYAKQFNKTIRRTDTLVIIE